MNDKMWHCNICNHEQPVAEGNICKGCSNDLLLYGYIIHPDGTGAPEPQDTDLNAADMSYNQGGNTPRPTPQPTPTPTPQPKKYTPLEQRELTKQYAKQQYMQQQQQRQQQQQQYAQQQQQRQQYAQQQYIRPMPAKKSNTGLIVGLSIGGAVLLFVIIIVVAIVVAAFSSSTPDNNIEHQLPVNSNDHGESTPSGNYTVTSVILKINDALFFAAHYDGTADSTAYMFEGDVSQFDIRYSTSGDTGSTVPNWSVKSSDESVLSIAGNILTARRAGSVTITATVGGMTVSQDVNIIGVNNKYASADFVIDHSTIAAGSYPTSDKFLISNTTDDDMLFYAICRQGVNVYFDDPDENNRLPLHVEVNDLYRPGEGNDVVAVVMSFVDLNGNEEVDDEGEVLRYIFIRCGN